MNRIRSTLAASVLACLVTTTALPVAAVAQSAAKPLARDWQKRIRKDHPRMFFNVDTWPQVKDYALKHEADYYAGIKRHVASMPATPDAKVCESGSTPKYGLWANQAAFIWRMEGDREALDKARNYVLEAVRFYNRCSSAGKAVNWYSASRVAALTAYDWICDEMTAAQRKEFALGFFRHYKECLGGRPLSGQNRGDTTSGFYGPPNMAWYLGLAFYGDGIDDKQAEQLLKQGYAEHIQLLNYRKQAVGDDGGMGSIAVGYAFGMYPWAEFNFMRTYNSATGLALEESYDHMSLFANWVLWNHLPGHMGWGLGDSAPAGPFTEGFLDMHMLQAADFYATVHPDRARLALWVRDNLLTNRRHDDLWWPIAPLLTTRCGQLPKPEGPDATWPLARNFDSMGVVFMRSDWTDDAVCAAFVCGGSVNSHRHYDQGHFIIYRKGHLAIDSGDYGPRERNDHLSEYLYRTVAHNSILIAAPAGADRPAKVWGGAARTLDGGQCEFAGKQIGFETTPQFSYAATDMTACYAPAKCKAAVRQFVFVYPDTFVICDRVVAARADYRKTWLLHSVNEPTIDADGKTFRIEYGPSALVGRTMAPGDARIAAVGGPGKEFLSAGSNHPQEGQHKELSGAWRVEVSPGKGRTEDIFLHVLRVGDKSLSTDLAVAPVEKRGMAGVSLKTSAGDDVTVTFKTAGAPGGHITIGDKLNCDLADRVRPQDGLAVEKEAGQ
ncbi:MAG: heparinase II/III family protein [Planctomycetes bacterium]|nr:heparinase II/III family protein [Planctomycetota bacterium]